MAYTIREQLGSGDGASDDNPQRQMRYLVTGDNPAEDTESGALAAAYDAAPPTLEGLPKLGGNVDSLGGWTWQVEINYRPSASKIVPPPVAGDPSRESFTTVGGTRNVKRSLETIQRLGPVGDLAPDLGGLINVTEDAVEGVDIVVPAYVETVVRYVADSAVNTAFKSTLRDLTGAVNNAAFRGFEAGEVKFLGATGEKRPADGVWEITYQFEVIKNQTGINVGDIPAFDLKGHDYVWFRTKPTDAGAGVYPVPRHGYVEQVSPYADLSALGV